MKLLGWMDDVDCWLLILTHRSIRFCAEWLSWRQRPMERVLIAVFGISHVALFGMYDWWFRAVGILTTLVLMHGLRRQHRFSDQIRRSALLDEYGAIPRWIALLIVFVRAAMFVLPPGRLLLDGSGVAVWTLFAGLQYMMSLPASDDDVGKRRRLALEKLKELFGSSWVPEPVSEGA